MDDAGLASRYKCFSQETDFCHSEIDTAQNQHPNILQQLEVVYTEDYVHIVYEMSKEGSPWTDNQKYTEKGAQHVIK